RPPRRRRRGADDRALLPQLRAVAQDQGRAHRPHLRPDRRPAAAGDLRPGVAHPQGAPGVPEELMPAAAATERPAPELPVAPRVSVRRVLVVAGIAVALVAAVCASLALGSVKVP